MKIVSLNILMGILYLNLQAQEIDEDLLRIRHVLENVVEAKGRATLELDVDFINMPVKHAQLHYQKGKPLKYTSENFIIIPKRGLDFSWYELFRYEFMTVDRGFEAAGNQVLKVLNVIPLDKKADFAIMTLKLNTVDLQIKYAEITTKNEGTYYLSFKYSGKDVFPTQIEVNFELERIKIPLSFMGKDAEIDKDQLKSDAPKKGIITLDLEWFDIIHNR